MKLLSKNHIFDTNFVFITLHDWQLEAKYVVSNYSLFEKTWRELCKKHINESETMQNVKMETF